MRALRVLVNRFREGIRSIELQAPRQSLIRGDPQSVVTRITGGFAEGNILQRGSGFDRTGWRESRKRAGGDKRGIQECLVQVSRQAQMRSFGGKVSGRDRQARFDFALDVEVPRLNIRVVEIWI